MELKQKIHDALLIELVKKDNNGKFPNLLKLVRDGNFSVKCSVDLKNGKGCVDVVLTFSSSQNLYVSETKNGGLIAGVFGEGRNPIAFELITDIDFDAGKKLEQVNRYKRGFSDVRVIIPEEYSSRYSHLFAMNDIKVHTWTGTRRWKGKYCEHITEVKDSSEKPIKCIGCEKTELYFVGFKDDVVFK